MPNNILENQRLERDKIFKKLTRRARKLVKTTKDTKGSKPLTNTKKSTEMIVRSPPRGTTILAAHGGGKFKLSLNTPKMHIASSSDSAGGSHYNQERALTFEIEGRRNDRASINFVVSRTQQNVIFHDQHEQFLLQQQKSVLNAFLLRAAMARNAVIASCKRI